MEAMLDSLDLFHSLARVAIWKWTGLCEAGKLRRIVNWTELGVFKITDTFSVLLRFYKHGLIPLLTYFSFPLWCLIHTIYRLFLPISSG